MMSDNAFGGARAAFGVHHTGPRHYGEYRCTRRSRRVLCQTLGTHGSKGAAHYGYLFTWSC